MRSCVTHKQLITIGSDNGMWPHQRQTVYWTHAGILLIPCQQLTWWRHRMETFSALLTFCAGNSPVPVNSPHKGQWRGALMFSLIWTSTNGLVNNREAGDLRRHRAHYVIVMICSRYHALVIWYHHWRCETFGIHVSQTMTIHYITHIKLINFGKTRIKINF